MLGKVQNTPNNSKDFFKLLKVMNNQKKIISVHQYLADVYIACACMLICFSHIQLSATL